MADLLHFPHEAMAVIPEKHKHVLHSMYEDSDLDGSREAERLIEFLEQEAPGSFVGVLANSCYRPGCDTWVSEHFHCEVYDPTWTTILIAKPIWQQYEEQVKAAEQKFQQEHGCKLLKEETSKGEK